MTNKDRRREPTTCNVHKKYKAKLPPRPTKKNPHGCPACWCQYFESNVIARLERLERLVMIHERNIDVLTWGPE